MVCVALAALWTSVVLGRLGFATVMRLAYQQVVWVAWGPSLLTVSALYYGVLSAVAIVDIRYLLFCPYYSRNNLNTSYFFGFPRFRALYERRLLTASRHRFLTPLVLYTMQANVVILGFRVS